MVCPNKNLSEWKQLVDSLGEAHAMLSYIRNGNNIPTITEAETLIFNSDLVNTIDAVASTEDALYSRSVVDNNSRAAATENAIKPMNKQQLQQEGLFASMSESAREVFDNFETYFPNYRYLTNQQRYVFVSNMENGSLQIKCGI